MASKYTTSHYCELIGAVVTKKTERIDKFVAEVGASIAAISAGDEEAIRREAARLSRSFPMHMIEMADHVQVCCEKERLEQILPLFALAVAAGPAKKTAVPHSVVTLDDKRLHVFFVNALKAGVVPSNGLYIVSPDTMYIVKI
jgi:hypothetical protein